jgi:hypothetical protein
MMRVVTLWFRKISDHRGDDTGFRGGVLKLALNAIIVGFLIFGLPQSGSAQNTIYRIFDGDVQVLSSDETGMTLDYTVPSASLIGIEGYAEQYKYPQIERTAQNRIPGQPLLPIKIIPVAVPYGAKPLIKVLSQNYSLLAIVEVAPFVATSSAESFSAEVAAKSQNLRNWPDQVAYIAGEEVIRGLRIIKIGLASVKYQNGALYKAENLSLRVDFNNGSRTLTAASRPVGEVFDYILSKTVVNYDIAKGWRADWPQALYKMPAEASPFDSASVWVKMEISASGIYKVTRYELAAAGVDVDQIDPRQFRVFYGGGEELPFDNADPKPQLEEIPIAVSGSDDGSFDYNDQLLFFGEATDRFKHSAQDGRYIYRRNHYTARNVYWLACGGSFVNPPRRWPLVDGTPQGTPFMIMTSFEDNTHDEQEIIFYRSESSGEFPNYFEWYWGRQTNFSINVQLPDYVLGTQAKAIIKTRMSSNGERFFANGIQATRDSVYRNPYYNLTFYRTTNLNSGYNNFVMDNSTEFFLDYVEVNYTRLLKLVDNTLAFTAPINPGLIEYHVAGTPADYILLDISSSDSIKQIASSSLAADTLKFQNQNAGHRRFYITNPSRYRTISRYTPYQPDNLRDPANAADYVIITHSLFKNQADELAALRRRVNPAMAVRVVNVDDIYNQFSWGLFDPLAIRDFLRYAFENWTDAQPAYALLVGDGHFDYRNNMGSGRPYYIPPFEAVDPPEAGASASDENYIYFGPYGYFDADSSGSLDMIIGRLPVNSTEEMDVVLNKTINYEEHPVMGKWRNNIIISADDNNGDARSPYEWFHTTQAESLANRHVPRSLEVQKIYMIDYPYRAGGYKPDAREAFIDAFNNGALIVDWIGHGNKGLWAHEQFFRRVEDIPRLHNGGKLPMVLAASCSIGFFDDPLEQGMSEDFVRYSQGGAIASIGATRIVWAGPNTDLNNEVYDNLLYDDSTTFGGALYIAKFLRQNPGGPNSNDRNFIFFGDPALVAGKPILKTRFTYQPDSLKGLTVDSIAGQIFNGSGQFQSDFNGTVQVLVKDASINHHKALTDRNNVPINPPNYIYVDYILPGATIFSGPAQVTNGIFSTSFFVPKDITYGGAQAKIYVYIDNGLVDGSGVVDSLPIAGGVSGENDTTGPSIEVTYDGRNLTGNIAGVPSGARLDVTLFDPHGINITGAMGHGIIVSIDDGQTYQTDITSQFSFDLGSWQRGKVSFGLPELAEGEHGLSLKAWDNYNNSATFNGALMVFEDESFAITEVMNYPNPAKKVDRTEFQYRLNRSAEMISLKIFTLAGRKIKSWQLDSPEYLTNGYHKLAYNLRDNDGDQLASGVYIYKIEAVGLDANGQKKKVESQSKLVVLR